MVVEPKQIQPLLKSNHLNCSHCNSDLELDDASIETTKARMAEIKGTMKIQLVGSTIIVLSSFIHFFANTSTAVLIAGYAIGALVYVYSYSQSYAEATLTFKGDNDKNQIIKSLPAPEDITVIE